MHPNRARLIAGAALLLAPYVVMIAWLAAKYGLLVAAGYALAVGLGLLLLAGIGRTARSFYLLHGCLFVLALVFAAYAVIVGELPSYPIAFVLETSSWEEVRGFFGTWQQQRLLLAILAMMAAYVAVGFNLPRNFRLVVNKARSRRVTLGAACVLAAAAAWDGGKFMEGAAASPIIGTALFINGPLSSANAAVNGVYLRKRPYGGTRDGAKEVHILIVGESSRRDSWSVYGYQRRTTPFLDGLRDQAVFLTNVRSDANATVYAVPMLLTGVDPERFSFTSMTGNIVDLAKEAGYRSSWLVNQDAGVSHLVGMSADTVFYTISVSKPSYVVYPPDGLLLPKLAKQLAHDGSSLFIGMHVFGSHSPYSNRYPESFGNFGGSSDTRATSAENKLMGMGTATVTSTEIIDAYDNSILYTDWFLEQVII